MADHKLTMILLGEAKSKPSVSYDHFQENNTQIKHPSHLQPKEYQCKILF